MQRNNIEIKAIVLDHIRNIEPRLYELYELKYEKGLTKSRIIRDMNISEATYEKYNAQLNKFLKLSSTIVKKIEYR